MSLCSKMGENKRQAKRLYDPLKNFIVSDVVFTKTPRN